MHSNLLEGGMIKDGKMRPNVSSKRGETQSLHSVLMRKTLTVRLLGLFLFPSYRPHTPLMVNWTLHQQTLAFSTHLLFGGVTRHQFPSLVETPV